MTFKDFLRKLASRKFITMVTAIATAILVYCNADQNAIAQVSAVIGAFGTMITYIFSQGAVDKATVTTNGAG